jgi:hypothetical protein
LFGRFDALSGKSYPDVLVLQPGQDWDGDNDTGIEITAFKRGLWEYRVPLLGAAGIE